MAVIIGLKAYKLSDGPWICVIQWSSFYKITLTGLTTSGLYNELDYKEGRALIMCSTENSFL